MRELKLLREDIVLMEHHATVALVKQKIARRRRACRRHLIGDRLPLRTQRGEREPEKVALRNDRSCADSLGALGSHSGQARQLNPATISSECVALPQSVHATRCPVIITGMILRSVISSVKEQKELMEAVSQTGLFS